MYKYIGLAILFICSIYIGQTAASTYKKAVKQIEAFIQFLKYIKSQIEYYNTPYPDIFEKYTNNILEQNNFIYKLRSSDWKTALDETTFSFDNNVKELLYNFGNEIGRSMKEEQTSNCSYTIEQLEIHYNNFKSDLPKKIKLCTSLSVMAGLSIVIILI